MCKKVFLMFLAVVFTANMASAQMILIGNMGFNYAGGNSTTGGQSNDLPSRFAFQVSPKAAIFLTKNLGVGIGGGFSSSITNDHILNTKQITNGWSACVFARRLLVAGDRVALNFDGSINVAGAKTKASNPINRNAFSIEFAPVVAYNLSERFNIALASDFLKLGFQSVSSIENKDARNEVKTKNNSFGLGFNSNNLLENSSFLKIALVVKFQTNKGQNNKSSTRQ